MDTLSELRVLNADLADRLQLRQEESDNLRDLLKDSSAEIVSLQIRLRESRQEVSSLNTEILPLRHQFNNLSRKSTIQEKHNLDLENGLAVKKRELSECQKKLGDLTFEATAQMRSVRCELEQVRFKAGAQEDQLSLSNERNDQLLRQVQELEVAAVERFTAYDQEIDRKDALLAIYSDRCVEAEKRVQELERDFALSKEEYVAEHAAAIETLLGKHTLAVEGERVVAAARLKSVEDQLAAAIQRTSDSRSSVAIVAHHLNAVEPMYPEDLYKAYDAARQEIAVERGARREAELYLGKILKELETKAPVFAQQKAQFTMLQQEKDRVVTRMDAVLRENGLLRDHLHSIEADADAAVEEAAAWKTQSNDLSRQLQHILSGESSADTSSMDVISERLVTFADAQELQTRNAQLLKVVRALSSDADAVLRHAQVSEQRGYGPSKDNKQLSETLSAALVELGHMREARSNAEELLQTTVQQRDELRSMLPSNALTKVDKENLPINAIAAPVAPVSDDGGSAVKKLQLRCDSLHAEMLQIRKEKDDATAGHSSIQTTLRAELASLRSRIAHAEGQLRSATDKNDRVERSLSSLRVECASTVDSRLELEMLVSDLERRLRSAEADAHENACVARAAEDSARASDTEAELSRSAEHAALEALAMLNEKLKTEAMLGESLRRVEAGLVSRHEEDKAAIAHDRDGLARDLQALRKQLHELELLSTQRCAALDAELMLCRTSLDERSSEAHNARLMLVRQEGLAKGAQDRVALLERQLLHTQERMSALQGLTSIDDLMAKESAEREAALTRARDSAADSNALAALAEQHAEHFQAIAEASETKWSELRETHRNLIAQNKEELTALQESLDEIHVKYAAEQERATSLNAAFEKASSDLDALQSGQAALVIENEAALGAAQAEAAAQRLLSVQQEAEIERLNQHLSSAEISLTEHRALLQTATEAQAAATAEAQRTATALALNNQAIAELSASAVVQQLQLSEDKSKAETALAELQEQSKEVRRSNDLLHSQMQILSARVRRYEEDRSRGSAPPAGDDVAAEEQAQLRVSLDELREVLGIIKRERDTLTAKLAVAESEAARHQSAAVALQGAMDEARLVSKRENDKSAPTRNESDFARLLQQVQQLGKVREQAQSVHMDNERLSQTNDKLARELQVIKDGAAPRERQVRILQSEKSALEAQVTHLNKERTEWVARLQEVMDRYKDVDPSEYRALRDKETSSREALALCQKQLQETTMAVVELKKTHTIVLTAKDDEIATLRHAKEALEKSGDNLRIAMRQLKARAEASQESLRELDILKVEVETLRAAAAAHEQIDAETRVMMEAEDDDEYHEDNDDDDDNEEAADTFPTATASAAVAVPAVLEAETQPTEVRGARSRKRGQPEAVTEQLTMSTSSANTPHSMSASATLEDTSLRPDTMSSAEQKREMDRIKALLIQNKAQAAQSKAQSQIQAVVDEAVEASATTGAAPPAKRTRPARSASIINAGLNKVTGDEGTSSTSTRESSGDALLTSLLKPSAPAFVPSAASSSSLGSIMGTSTSASITASAGPTFGTGGSAAPFGKPPGGFFGFLGASKAAPPVAEFDAPEDTSEEAHAKAKRAARFNKDGGSTGE